MPQTVPSSFVTEIEKVHQTSPFKWLWEIVADDPEPPTAPTWFRLVAHEANVVWNSKTFYAYNLKHSPLVWSSDGDLPTMRLVVSNVARLLMPYLETGDGFQGRRATAYVVNTGNLGASEVMQFDFQIATATATRDACEFRLRLPNFFDKLVPVDRYNAERCRWGFGGVECGYIINAIAAYQTCGKTLYDCINRGLDEAARNLPVLHPIRFGGFAGVPVQR